MGTAGTASSVSAGTTQDVLRLLSVGSSTGALDVAGGGVRGTIHLAGGRVTFAESARTPDLATRLVRSGAIDPDRWRALVHHGEGDDVSLAAAARRPGLPPGLVPVLVSVLRSAVVDAASALLSGSAAATSRFTPGRRHPAGGLAFWEVEALLAEIARLEPAVGVHDGDVPQLHPAAGGVAVVVAAPDWPLLGRIDGRTSISALAWQNGLALHDVRRTVARLTAAGVCRPAAAPPPPTSPPPAALTLVRIPAHRAPARPATSTGAGDVGQEPPRRQHSAGVAGTRVDESRMPGVRAEGLPRRHPRERGAAAATVGTREPGGPVRDPVLLRRVLEGLRRM